MQRLAGEKCSTDGFRIEVEEKDVEGAQGLERRGTGRGFPEEGKKLEEGVWRNLRSRFPHEGGLGGVRRPQAIARVVRRYAGGGRRRRLASARR